jgi:hypothetical protein
MSRQKISLNNLSGPDSQDLSVRYPADRIRVSAWYCQNLSEVPACYLGITRGRVRPFYLPVLPLYGFTKLYTNPFLLIYLLPNFKLPVLVPVWGLEQKKTKFGFPQRDRPAPSFRVGRDVYAGYFVVLRPSDGDKRPFWIARALTNVDAEPVEHPQCILIQYWKPSSSSNHIQETYVGWDGDRSMQWTIEDSQPPITRRKTVIYDCVYDCDFSHKGQVLAIMTCTPRCHCGPVIPDSQSYRTLK